MFELKTLLPGTSELHVQVWDYDDYTRDDLIGETVIDLENRYFSKKWRKLKHVPIERRQLVHPLSVVGRGFITLWVEIIQPSLEPEKLKKVWDIKPKPPSDFEIRVIVWECEDVPASDWEDTSDIFITGRIGKELQKTDTHWRSQNGCGSFNWRMLFPMTLSTQITDPTLNIQIWDKDVFCPNDFIAEATIDFRYQAESAFENDCNVKIKGTEKVEIEKKSATTNTKEKAIVEKKIDKFAIKTKNAKKAGYVTLSDVGVVFLSFEIVPGEDAKANKVGLGRGEPNQNPWLPPPTGRIQWSWNPWTMFKQLVGPRARRKICMCCCVMICTSICAAVGPVIMGNLITKPFK